MNIRHCLILLLALASTPFSIRAAEPPRVVVSIAPVHSLIAGLMKGVAAPELLVKSGVSHHSFSLRPSHMRAITQANAIFWLGAEAETFLGRPLASARPEQRIFNLMQSPGLTLLGTRSGGAWREEHEEKDSGAHDHRHEGKTTDPHIWLDPLNAEAMVKAATVVLIKADPERAAQYQENSDRLLFQLQNLDMEMRDSVALAKGKPYLVFHDAYQYFEHRYGLNAAGAISISPERRPGARRLREIQRTLKEINAHCIFVEPQFPSNFLQAIVEEGEYNTGTLDPLGIDIQPGPDMYFILMRRLSSALVACLCQVYADEEMEPTVAPPATQ
ncbi:zinc ABC transporter substrate-binding protein [Pseudomonadota bacterium]